MLNIYTLQGRSDAVTALGIKKYANSLLAAPGVLSGLESGVGQGSGLEQLIELAKQHPLVAAGLSIGALLALRTLSKKEEPLPPYTLTRPLHYR